MSEAGREILIKAVVQTILSYTMSCFMLPLGLCNEIEGLVCKFWRGHRGEQQKIHWVKWGDMYDPKLEGGMGFKELVLFNEALLAKQT